MLILLVEDDPLVLRAIKVILEMDGHSVVGAAGGQEGIATFEAAFSTQSPFDVVITDLGMPGMDGRQVASAVKKRSPLTPVFLLTGSGERPESVNRADFDRVISKPPRIRELREALMKCGA